jgi:uncharacterized protein (DUF488 family)
MPYVLTIGYRGKSLDEFIGLLRAHEVDMVIDVRLRNTSHLAGYTKRDDLAFLLGEGFGIAYEHHPELAPADEILSAYQQDKDWDAYERAFAPLLLERGMAEVGRDILSRARRPCLLCAETTAEQCHRRLVAEHWAESIDDTTILHL